MCPAMWASILTQMRVLKVSSQIRNAKSLESTSADSLSYRLPGMFTQLLNPRYLDLACVYMSVAPGAFAALKSPS